MTNQNDRRAQPRRVDYERFVENVESHGWTTAKTMPTAPHQYSLRKTWRDDGEFLWTVCFIRVYGSVLIWRGKPYIVFRHAGKRYWTMDTDVLRTQLINRSEDSPENV